MKTPERSGGNGKDELAQHRRLQEKDWHDEFFRSRQDSSLVIGDSVRSRYFDVRNPNLYPLERMFELVGDVRDKKVLCFGCGDENSTVLLALKGAEVWGFDLSVAAIEKQVAMARANGVDDRVHLIVSAAEHLAFNDESFDTVFGSAILHHLPDSIMDATRELERVMRRDAIAVFSEPVERGRFMRFLRKLFPPNPELSPGERKLRDEDFQPLAQNFRLEFFPYNLFARFSVFLESCPFGDSRPIAALKKGLFAVDSLLFRIPGIERLAGIVVVKATLLRSP